ncbi:hypothetical protein M514_06788, partial [Trichuris suis]
GPVGNGHWLLEMEARATLWEERFFERMYEQNQQHGKCWFAIALERLWLHASWQACQKLLRTDCRSHIASAIKRVPWWSFNDVGMFAKL